MSAAVNNLVDRKEFTQAYEALLRHYRLTGQKIQAGQAHENGDVEQRHYRFKQAVDQALMMRGSHDFATVTAYDEFLRKLFARMNAGRRERLAEEPSWLRPLPGRRLDSMRRERARVTPGSLIHVHRNTYSVHSRLIGEMVEARIKSYTVEIWMATRSWKSCPGCVAGANIASMTGTSLTGSFGNPELSSTIGIGRICFPRVGSAYGQRRSQPRPRP